MVSVVGDLRHIACRSTAYAVVPGAEVSLDASSCNHNAKTKPIPRPTNYYHILKKYLHTTYSIVVLLRPNFMLP